MGPWPGRADNRISCQQGPGVQGSSAKQVIMRVLCSPAQRSSQSTSERLRFLADWIFFQNWSVKARPNLPNCACKGYSERSFLEGNQDN